MLIHMQDNTKKIEAVIKQTHCPSTKKDLVLLYHKLQKLQASTQWITK